MCLVLTTKWLLLKQKLGLLTIKGDNLRINKLSLDTTEIAVDGIVNSLAYSDVSNAGDMKKGGSFLGKIFK